MRSFTFFLFNLPAYTAFITFGFKCLYFDISCNFFIFNYRVNQIANLCAVSAEELIHEMAVLGREVLLGPESGAGPATVRAPEKTG